MTDQTDPDKTARSRVNALFRLACGCILDGCHDSHSARHFAGHGPGGVLLCRVHGRTTLGDVVSLAPLEPLPPTP